MPRLQWEKISEIKHALAQERTIICGVIIRLRNLDTDETIKRLIKCDQRLKILEDQLVLAIEAANGEDNNGNKK